MIRFENHAFKGLDEALRQLFEALMRMGDGAQQIIALLPAALDAADAKSFARAKEMDRRVNEAEREVDLAVASIINKFTVAGEDLRFTLGAIKIASTLERVADKAKNCTKRLSRVSQPLAPEIRDGLRHAADALAAMMPLGLGLILDYQAAASEALLVQGARVQTCYRTIILHLHAHQCAADDETHALLVAKNLEQAADMLVEIMKISHFIHFASKYEKQAG